MVGASASQPVSLPPEPSSEAGAQLGAVASSQPPGAWLVDDGCVILVPALVLGTACRALRRLLARRPWALCLGTACAQARTERLECEVEETGQVILRDRASDWRGARSNVTQRANESAAMRVSRRRGNVISGVRIDGVEEGIVARYRGAEPEPGPWTKSGRATDGIFRAPGAHGRGR